MKTPSNSPSRGRTQTSREIIKNKQKKTSKNSHKLQLSHSACSASPPSQGGFRWVSELGRVPK